MIKGLNVSSKSGVMLLVAGLFGSLLAVGKNSSGNIKDNFLSIAAGTSSAYFLTPLIFEVLQMQASQNAQSGVAFLLGVLGMRGVEFAINKLMPGAKDGDS